MTEHQTCIPFCPRFNIALLEDWWMEELYCPKCKTYWEDLR